jgi:hypothetical protein
VCGGDKEWARSIKMRCAMKSLFSPPIGLRFLLVADAQTAPSFLWFAAIQGVECKERLDHLAPQGCFIAAETIEREIGQISQTQKAARNVDGWITPRGDRSSIGARR